MGYARGIGGAVVEAPLPSELAAMAPGPELAALLASIDRSLLTADQMLDLIAARARLLWHVQGELAADFAQTVSATLTAEPLRPDEDEEQVIDAVGELVGWTVHWARAYAQGQVEVAVVLYRRLPMVLAAVRDGQIDQAKAAAFAEALACVDDETAARIATKLLPKARRWTLTELRASLRYHVDKADPGAARRRYRRRVAQRDVTLQAQPDGTASLYGQGLAPHRAAAAFDRIDRIARAARASGDVRNLAQLRADAMCDVLAGVPFPSSPSTDPLTAEADASAESGPPPVWSTPDWRTESRFTTRKTAADDPAHAGPAGGGGLASGGGPRGDGCPGGDGASACGGGGSRGDGHGPRGAGPLDLVPPVAEPVGVIDLYDYDRACLTDVDRAWANIGCEPPGAGADETPDWWHACRLAQRPPARHHPHRPTNQQPAPAEAEESCSGNGISRLEPSGSEQPAQAEAEADAEAVKSRFENGNPRPAPTEGELPTQAQAEKSRSENRNPGLEPSGSEPPAQAQAEAETDSETTKSRFENGILVLGVSGCDGSRPRLSDDGCRGPDLIASRYRRSNLPSPSLRLGSGLGRDPEDVEWAAAQADALHDRAVLSSDVLVGDRCGCGGRLSVRPGVVDLQIN